MGRRRHVFCPSPYAAKEKLRLHDLLRTAAREEGVPPSVNESEEDFQAVGEDIRFGMGAIRNVGSEVVESIIKSRHDKGAFTSFSDYLDKIELAVRQ